MKVSTLVGNGRKIGLLALPVIIIGLILFLFWPATLSIGGPYKLLNSISIIILIPGIINWAWSVILILKDVPKKKLITYGPYAIVKHPLYNGVSILVLPWIGFLLNTWFGLVLGLTILIGSMIYAKEEEEILKNIFKEKWTEYDKKVLIPWL